MKVEWNIHDEWINWLKQYHIPAILEYKCFTDFRLLKLREIDESDGVTYAVQFFAESKADYNRYVELFAGEISLIERKFWGTKLFTFGTLMEVVN